MVSGRQGVLPRQGRGPGSAGTWIPRGAPARVGVPTPGLPARRLWAASSQGCRSSAQATQSPPLPHPSPSGWFLDALASPPPPHAPPVLSESSASVTQGPPLTRPAGLCPGVESSGERGSQAWICRHSAKAKNPKTQGHPEIHRVGPSTGPVSALEASSLPSTRSGWKHPERGTVSPPGS